jgi:hypothetical protein
MRFDIFIHSEQKDVLAQLIQGQEKLMALGQDILNAITAENTLIDSFLTLVQGLVANNTIDQPTADAIKAAIQAEADKVQAAITANTPPPTP